MVRSKNSKDSREVFQGGRDARSRDDYQRDSGRVGRAVPGPRGRQNIAFPVGGGSLPEELIAVSLEGADKGSTRP